MLTAPAFHKNAVNEVFNITRGEGRSLYEFACIVRENIKGTKLKIIKEQGKVFRPTRGALDISKAKKKIGYRPVYSLERGLPVYIEYVRKNLARLKLLKR